MVPCSFRGSQWLFMLSFLHLVKHYAFLVDGTADSSVKSFLGGNKSLEEFQKVVFLEAF